MAEKKSFESRFELYWKSIENELLKNNMAYDKVAVLEAEKILKKILEEKDIPGNSVEEKIEGFAKTFSNYEKLQYSRAMWKKIVGTLGFDISPQDTKEIISGYRTAISDLENKDISGSGFMGKMQIFVRRNFYGFPKRSKIVIAAIVLISLLTFILTETETGRSISVFLIGINDYVYYKIVPTAIIIVLLIAAAISFFYAYKDKKINR